MSYTILIEKPAQKFIAKLSRPDKERVIKAIHKLPNEGDIKELQGRNNKGVFRLRVGSYRILYKVDHGELLVCVIDADNRGDVYKRY